MSKKMKEMKQMETMKQQAEQMKETRKSVKQVRKLIVALTAAFVALMSAVSAGAASGDADNHMPLRDVIVYGENGEGFIDTCRYNTPEYDEANLVGSWYCGIAAGGQANRIDVFEDGSFAWYAGTGKVIGFWNRSEDGERTFDLMEREGEFIQVVNLSSNENYFTTWIDGKKCVFYKDNAETCIPTGADADAIESDFNGVWAGKYNGYSVLLTVDDGAITFASLDSDVSGSAIRNVESNITSDFKNFSYDFELKDYEIGWMDVKGHLFLMTDGTLKMSAGESDGSRKAFLTFEKVN